MQTLQIVAACIALILCPGIAAPQPTAEEDTHDSANGDADQNIQDIAQLRSRDTEASSAVSSTETIVSHYILSLATGMFLAITKSGRVQANAQIGRRVAQFYVTYSLINSREHVSLQSSKYSGEEWSYITVRADGKIRGGIPKNGSELFELVTVNGPTVALKAYSNYMTELEQQISGSGSGQNATKTSNSTETVQSCYLGFSILTGRPSCYDSQNYVEVHLLFLDGVWQ